MTFARKGMPYDTVLRMMNEPVRSRNAVELPRGIAPRARQRIPVIVSFFSISFSCH